MSDAVWVALITSVFGAGGAAIIKSVLDYRGRMKAPEPVTTAEATKAVAATIVSGDAPVTTDVLAATVGAMRADMDRALARQHREHEEEMQQVRGELQGVRSELQGVRRLYSLLMRYAGQLREDFARAGLTARDWPTELQEATQE